MWYDKLIFHRPATKAEALAVLDQQPAHLLAGGTDLLVNLKNVARQPARQTDSPTHFVNIADLIELQQIVIDGQKLTIGAGVTFSQYLRQADQVLPPLTEAIVGLAAPSIRNRATFGGNIINASPAADTLPVLYALDAELVLESASTTRLVTITDFITGPKQTILRPEELLTAVRLTIPHNYKHHYRKIGTRKALALSKVAFLGLYLPDTKEIRLAYGSVGPTVIRAYEAERLFLAGQIDSIPDCVERTVKPIDDQRSTAEYRRYLCRVLTDEFLNICQSSPTPPS